MRDNTTIKLERKAEKLRHKAEKLRRKADKKELKERRVKASISALNTNISSIIEKSQQTVGKIDTKTNLRVFFTLFVMLGITVALLISMGISFIVEYLLGELLQIHILWWVLIFSVLFGWVLAIIVGLFFLNPFIRLSLSMKRVAKGDFGIRLKTKSVFKLIREVYGSFNLMTEELGMTEILQTDFVSNVSHEFKTPINAIEGYATLLQSEDISEAERDTYVKKILLNTSRLSQLVSDILLISKIENQAIASPSISFRLDEQIRQSIVLLEPKWGEKDIDFDVELENTDYVGNENLLHHVWDNLIDNAVKFSPAGGEIKIRMEHRDNSILVSVTDSGEGIDEKIKDHIFDKFFQGDSSHKAEGNGLGLALAKRIVLSHGGNIEAENLPQGGCRFTVILPG